MSFILPHTKSSLKAGLSRQNIFFLIRANLRQFSNYSELPPRPLLLPRGHTLNQPALRFTYLQPVTQFSSWSLKISVSANAQSFQVMVSDTVISTFLLSSGPPFLKAWEAVSSKCFVTLFVQPLPLSYLLPHCTLTSWPASTSSSTSFSGPTTLTRVLPRSSETPHPLHFATIWLFSEFIMS